MYPTEFPLSPSVLKIVEKLEKDATTPQFLAGRANLLLEMSRGGSNSSVAERLRLHPKKPQRGWAARIAGRLETHDYKRSVRAVYRLVDMVTARETIPG